MRVGFFNHQLDIRGTGNAVFDYAHYNEELLGNESLIITSERGKHHPAMVQKVGARFGGFWTIDKLVEGNFPKVDVLYHIKSGGPNDEWQLAKYLPKGVRYGVHAVFDGRPVECDRLATISRWMGEKFNIPYVPHIVHLPDHNDNLRKDIGIPENAYVYGRHGGFDTFDIPWVWEAVNKALEDQNVWFLFMNTQVPDIKFIDEKRVVFVEASANAFHKRAFINSCDAMLHARSRGETFGIAVGEFAYCDKTVLTYAESSERAHLDELGGRAVVYYNEADLTDLLFARIESPSEGYKNFLPETVMNQFKEVFLEGD